MNNTYIARVFLSGVMFLMLASCSAINSGVGGYFGADTDLELKFVVDADINPDEKRKPSPLYLRLYELKSPKMFNKSDFISLYERDAEILGADLVAVQKLKPLLPGEGRMDSFVLDNKTTFIALYAEFLQYRDAKYRIVIPVTTTNVVSTKATIKISGNSIKLLEGNDSLDDDNASSQDKTNTKKSKSTAKKPQGVTDSVNDIP